MRIFARNQSLLIAVLLLTACSITPDRDQRLSETQIAFSFGQAAYKNSDFEEALARWLPLAKNGHAESAFRIADMYDYAQGVQQDYKESAKWFLMAAESGHGEAQLRIANRYASGTGVTKDIAAAYMWYWLCLNNDSSSARSKYWADLYSRTYFSVGILSSSQVNQIEAEAKKWKEKRI